jgi:hypothetical protein
MAPSTMRVNARSADARRMGSIGANGRGRGRFRMRAGCRPGCGRDFAAAPGLFHGQRRRGIDDAPCGGPERRTPPRRSQLAAAFVECETVPKWRLCRAAVNAYFLWYTLADAQPESKSAPKGTPRSAQTSPILPVADGLRHVREPSRVGPAPRRRPGDGAAGGLVLPATSG